MDPRIPAVLQARGQPIHTGAEGGGIGRVFQETKWSWDTQMQCFLVFKFFIAFFGTSVF